MNNQYGSYQQGHNGRGEASEYYSQSSQQGYPPQQGYDQQQFNEPGQFAPQQQNWDSQHQGYGHPNYNQYGSPNQSSYEQREGFENSEGERGLTGGLIGGAAGAVGGHKMGGVTGHSKTSTVFGAVAGAFAGHKMQDGIEDWRDDRKEKKEEELRKEEEERRRREEERRKHDHTDSHDKNGRRRSGHYAGGFSGSSRDIRLDAHGDYNLHASCMRVDGSYQSSTISLSRLLENDNGSFHWSGGQNEYRSSTVTVQQGDTLRTIAARHNCDFHEIARQNNINNPDMIYPGQTLHLPGGGGSSGGNGHFGDTARNARLVDGGQSLEAELRRSNGDWVQSSINLDERIGNRNGCLEFV